MIGVCDRDVPKAADIVRSDEVEESSQHQPSELARETELVVAIVGRGTALVQGFAGPKCNHSGSDVAQEVEDVFILGESEVHVVQVM